MAEARQTILERVALYIMELRGAEEVERAIEKVDIRFTKIAQSMEVDRKLLVQLGRAFKDVGRSLRPLNMEGINAVKFLEQYAIAAEKADEVGEDLNHVMYAQSEEGQRVAESFGLIKPKMEDAASATDNLKQKFWSLNSTARALLRVFVAFKILTGLVGIFSDIAKTSAELQMELWRLRATALAVGDSLKGGAPAWEEWVEMIERLRQDLPYVSTKEIAEGLRQITAIVGPLGLTADQLETLTRLIGQMSLVVGQDFLPYMRLIITAVTGTGRAVASLGIDLRDGSVGLRNYAEAAGLVWDELNSQQRIYVRLAYASRVMAERSELLAEAEEKEWVQLREIQKAREDIRAQAPGLIKLQLEWNRTLLELDKLLVRLSQNIGNWADNIVRYLQRASAAVDAFAIIVRRAIGGAAPSWGPFMEEYERRLGTMRQAGQDVGDVSEQLRGFGIGAKDAAEGASELEESLLGMAIAAADAAEELDDRMTRALQQAEAALRSYLSAVESAGIRLGRRLTDIVRNLEEKLADLEGRYEFRRAQLIRRFEERRAELREEGAEREEELREDLNKRLRRMEEDHLLDMQELREDYLLDLGEAARKRDAVSMRRIQQRYILEKKQRERDYGVRRRRAIEDYKEQIDELKKAREKQEEELERSLERQLRELQENYERQQEEARLNAERQREDALRNYQEQLSDLWRSFQERLETIAINLMEEEREYEDTYGDIRTFFDKWYTDDLTALREWLAKRAFMIQMAQLRESLPPWMQRFVPSADFGMAQGGMGIARQPTRIMVGEAGPEMFAAWPLGQRMPSQAIDIRLTMDGTQAGAWSADFENQTLRILREVLEEAL